MATPNRAALITKLHRTLKKAGKSPPPASDRTVLEHLLFACLLENAHYDTAAGVLAKLQASFFDLNEVRVSSVKELAEIAHALPDPLAAATRFKRALQNVFETSYSYDLDSLKKLNLSAADKQLRKLDGATPFVVAYVTQAALGGHAIPLDEAALQVLYVVGLIPSASVAADDVPGLTRAIPKNKGLEFGYLLHELAADFWANPFSTNARNTLMAVAPDAKDRFPKRGAKKAEAEPPREAAPAPVSEKPKPPAEKPPAEKPRAAEKTAPAKTSPAKPKAANKNGAPTPKATPKTGRLAKAGARASAKGLAKRKPR
jgi:endonuclease-3